MQFPIKLAQNANAIWPSPSSELQALAKAWAANLNAHLGQIWSKSPSTVDLHPTETRRLPPNPKSRPRESEREKRSGSCERRRRRPRAPSARAAPFCHGLLFSHRSLLPSTVVPQAAATATAILFSHRLATVVPQAAATVTAGCQATATAGSRAAAAGSRAIATRSPPPRRRHPSLFEFLAPPPSPYYECQGDGTPYLG
jgi:hypothetical protein